LSLSGGTDIRVSSIVVLQIGKSGKMVVDGSAIPECELVKHRLCKLFRVEDVVRWRLESLFAVRRNLQIL